MDRETLVFLGIFLTVVILGISCLFPKNERKRIILVSFGFVMFLALAPLCIWAVEVIFEGAPDWLGSTVAFIAYSILLSCFGSFAVIQSIKSHQTKKNESNESVD